MAICFFVSDLHGNTELFDKLLRAVAAERPAAVFLGGDLLPSGLVLRDAAAGGNGFIGGVLAVKFAELRRTMGEAYPRVMLILGNDDPRSEEPAILASAGDRLWEYVHGCKTTLGESVVYGYACVPPTPFALKDWERYDVSRHVDVGCLSPEEGHRSVAVCKREIRHATIRQDLDDLVGDDPLDRAVFLFHAPPYKSKLDRAALDGRMVDHVPLDVHVGSIAIRRFIGSRQPLVTMHGHIHESAELTGAWMERIGRTVCLSAAHNGPELALVRFDLDNPAAASRELI